MTEDPLRDMVDAEKIQLKDMVDAEKIQQLGSAMFSRADLGLLISGQFALAKKIDHMIVETSELLLPSTIEHLVQVKQQAKALRERLLLAYRALPDESN